MIHQKTWLLWYKVKSLKAFLLPPFNTFYQKLNTFIDYGSMQCFF